MRRNLIHARGSMSNGGHFSIKSDWYQFTTGVPKKTTSSAAVPRNVPKGSS